MYPASRSLNGPHLSLSLCRNGRVRSLAIGRWATLALLGVVAAATIWSLAAILYVCFHDALLASLMSRQAEMQYAYEDQIATLRTELDREASRGLIDRRMIDTALRELTVRSGRLETRAATLDKLLTDGSSGGTRDREPSSTLGAAIPEIDRSSLPGAPSADVSDPGRSGGQLPPARLRLEEAAGDRHARLEPDALAARLAAIEGRQLNEVVRLRDPLLNETHRLAAALAETGLGRRVLGDQPRDVGGPFVPLDTRGTDAFDMQVALMRDAREQRDRLAAAVDRVPLHVPLDGPMEVSSAFGARLDPFLGRPALHTGIDLRETLSDAVHATAAGIVTVAGLTGGYGNMVEIDHGAGLVTRYAHLSGIDVVVRQHVATGAVIGRVGSSGRATGPHLHYETRIDGEPVDPATFLTAATRLADD